MRAAQTTLILLTATAWGIWCGGDLTKFLGLSFLGFIGMAILLGLSTQIFRNKIGQISLIIGLIAATTAGTILGSGYASRAFNECVDRGELVRQELSKFNSEEGHYPNSLSELKMDLPGQRLLRGNIFDYQKTEAGYEIKFQDWLITHVADEHSGFYAQK